MDEISNDINPFSIAAEQQRHKALKAAGTSNITYSFAPRIPNKKPPAAKKKSKKQKKFTSDNAARASAYHKRLNGPDRSSLFSYYSKVYTAPAAHIETKLETFESDSDTDSAKAGGSARSVISRNDAITAQHARVRHNPPRACKHDISYSE